MNWVLLCSYSVQEDEKKLIINILRSHLLWMNRTNVERNRGGRNDVMNENGLIAFFCLVINTHESKWMYRKKKKLVGDSNMSKDWVEKTNETEKSEWGSKERK